MADGTIRFDTKIDNSGIKADIKKIENELKQIEKQKIKLELDGKNVDTSKARAELEELKAQLEEINRMKAEGFYQQNPNASYRGDIQSIQELINAKQQEINSNSQYESLLQRESILKEELNMKNSQLASSNVQIVATSQSQASAFKGVSNGLDAIKNAMTQVMSKGKNMNGFAEKLSNTFMSFFRLLKTRLKRQFISSIINNVKNAFQSLAKFSEPLNQAYSDLTATFQQLGGNLVGALAPILTAVIPIITQLIEWLNTGITALAKFFAMLTGKSTITKAVKQQKDYAKSVGASTSANQKLLASFDELNQLNETNTGAGESATIEYIEEAFSPWEDLKKLLDTGDWEGIGRLFAEKINEAIANIDFAQVGANIGQAIQKGISFAYGFLETIDTFQIGDGIAKMLVSGLEQIDFEMLGMTIVDALSRAVEFLIGILNPENHIGQTLGQSFANLINGVTKKLPEFLGDIGEGIGNLIVFLEEFLATAILGIDWVEVAKSVITGLLIGISNAFDKTTLNKILNYIFVENAGEFDTKEMEETGGMIGTAKYEGYYNAIEEQMLLEGDPLYNNIEKGDFSKFTESGKEKATAEVTGFTEGVSDALENTDPESYDLSKQVIDKVSERIDNGEFEDLGTEVITDFEDGVSNPEEVKAIKDVFEKIIKFLDTTFKTEWEMSWTNIATIFNNIWNGIIAAAEKAVNSVVDALNAINFTIPEWVDGYGGKSFALNLSHVSVPRLASGTVIPPNASEFLAILGDNNNDTEVVTPLETMKQALTEALATSGNQNITINFKGDLAQLARILKPAIENEDKRVGRSLITKGA